MELDADTTAAVATALGLQVTGTRWLAGGYSTGNWVLESAGEPVAVVRRYRPERSVCAVEAALLERLAGVVPVPRVLLADPGGTLAGSPVLVTSYVDGVPASAVVASGSPDDVGGVANAAGLTLARIGTVHFPASGFFSGDGLAVSAMDGSSDGVLAWVREHLDRSGGVPSDLRESWWSLVVAAAPVLDDLPQRHSLVHSDYNPKNLLVASSDQGWRVTAVLDWEFAYAGNPLADVGNWLRFAHVRPPAYGEQFVRGFRAAGGELPDHWRPAARTLDALAVVEFLSRGPGHAYYERAVGLLRDAVSRGGL